MRSRLKAFRQLRSQYFTECAFGWYVSEPSWRQQMRKLYPVEWVSAQYRHDITEEQAQSHFRRLKDFHKGLHA